MASNNDIDLTRRFVLVASAGFLLPRLGWCEVTNHPVLSWRLDGHNDAAHETVSGADDPIASRTGHARWVGEGWERALRLDGYSVWIDHAASQLPLATGGLSISAWLALESWPVDEASVVQIGGDPDAEARLSIDRWGHLHFKSRQGKEWQDCQSVAPVPKAEWVHVAATLGASGTTLYLAGAPRGSGPSGNAQSGGQPLRFANKPSVTVGRSANSPLVAGIFPTGVLNGLIKDVRVFDGAISPEVIVSLLQESRPATLPDLERNGAWCTVDIHRPHYHAMPPRAWTNEPHGLVYWRGEYHLFYQKNPSGPYWGHIHWGHMTSPDLYKWTELAPAIYPEPGPDSEGCWSGSVIEHDGRLALIYTGGDGHRSSICLASSDDGVHFTKHPGNPIIPAPPQGKGFPEFRDPFVWREGTTFYLIIGSAVKDVGGTALLYRSTNLVNWEYRKQLFTGDRETSGVFWEMPIFVKAGSNHALIVCEVPGRASYWVGSWENDTFTPFTTAPRRLELFNHLLSPTPCVLPDGRVIAMGIIPDQRSPKECWKAGWAHLYGLPRVLSSDSRGHLLQAPLEDIEKWGGPPIPLPDMTITEGKVATLAGASGTRLQLKVTFKRGDSHAVSLLLRRSADSREQTQLRYEWEIGRLVLDRSQSSLDPLVKRDVQEATYFPPERDSISLTVFLDESVLEVFADDRAAFAARIYPTLPDADGIAMTCAGISAEAKGVFVRGSGKFFEGDSA